jgi:methylphosphotriester-DNA--protein-cysteine methyltransferase
MVLRCPVCKAENSQGPTCRRCKADLAMLFALEERRSAEVAAAAAALADGQAEEARTHALAVAHLRADAESARLLALAALACGDYNLALRLRQEALAAETA